ncbi:MAG: metallophosphoesterase family protein [Rhodobacter sp.]|nr:metallophosphoesterase family protein [Rhodobacter sp.]
MRILAFSDLHHARGPAEALVAASAEADIVIGAGDFCNMRQDLTGAMNLLGGISKPFVTVPGNAESFDELQDAAHQGTHVLHGTGTDIDGLAFFGLGYGVPVTPFGAWSCDLSELDAAALLSQCRRADVLITHSPPKGVADVTSGGLSVGSTAVRDAIERLQPQLAVCGHIHDSWGREGRIGRTRVVNLGPGGTWFDVSP